LRRPVDLRDQRNSRAVGVASLGRTVTKLLKPGAATWWYWRLARKLVIAWVNGET